MRIYIHTEQKVDPDVLEVDGNATVAAALELGEGEVALLEDEEAPLDATASLSASGARERTHLFRGRRQKIDVSVEYNGDTHAREFPASARVHRVLEWAVGKQAFDLDPQDAAEHMLALPDESVPPEDAHIGSLPEPEPGKLLLQLVAKERFEG
jgi:hypothetical protein